MIHAYNELYLSDAQQFLATAFDYALNDCKIEPDLFESIFSNSKLSKQFETGDPSTISGKSGVEGIRDLLETVCPNKEFINPSFDKEYSPEYWAGYYLAYYQWFKCKRFEDIFKRVPLKDIISMYKIYHEMDVLNFVEDLDNRYNSVVLDTKLKKMREARGLSQSGLAKESGVTKRSIQLYEQKVNDIDKAQAHTLYKLSLVLGCKIEDLLENPIEI